MKKAESLPHPNLTTAFPFKNRRRFSKNTLKYLVFVATFATFSYYYFLQASLAKPRSPNEAAGNSTLGFGKILVLSKAPSWRTRGLIAAATYTGLDIQIPKQPHVTIEMIEALQKMGPEDVKHPKKGEASNWLAHLDMVKYVVASDFETALILEDDVDWDVSLKNQMRLISSAVREFTYIDDKDTTPYGSSWDILWIGHCGEHTGEDTRRIEFTDPTVPLAKNYTGWAKDFVKVIAPGKRAVQRGVNPVCTFGYALTRRGAEKVLKWAGKGENEAFDIRLMQGCKEKHLSCLTINPEVMHHYVPPGEFGHISTVAEVNGRGSEAEDEEFEKVMGNTANIVCSTRCRVLFQSTCQRI